MEKIYSTGYDHDVKKVVLYTAVAGGNNFLYKDKACTVTITRKELADLYMKGLILIADNDGVEYMAPTSAYIADDGVVLTAGTGQFFPSVNE